MKDITFTVKVLAVDQAEPLVRRDVNQIMETLTKDLRQGPGVVWAFCADSATETDEKTATRIFGLDQIYDDPGAIFGNASEAESGETESGDDSESSDTKEEGSEDQ